MLVCVYMYTRVIARDISQTKARRDGVCTLYVDRSRFSVPISCLWRSKAELAGGSNTNACSDITQGTNQASTNKTL